MSTSRGRPEILIGGVNKSGRVRGGIVGDKNPKNDFQFSEIIYKDILAQTFSTWSLPGPKYFKPLVYHYQGKVEEKELQLGKS